MVREIIRPSSNNYTIHIPEEYINKEVEILIFPCSHSEKSNSHSKIFDPKDFYNVSKSTKTEIDLYLESHNNEWESYL